MSLTRLKADIKVAAQKAAAGNLAGIASIKGGPDGEVSISYHHTTLPREIRIQAVCQDVGDYPDGNLFMVFAEDDDPPKPVTNAIQSIQDYLLGLRVYEVALELSKSLQKAFGRSLDGAGSSDGSQPRIEEEEDDGDDDGDDDDYLIGCDDDELFGLPTSEKKPSNAPTTARDTQHTRQRMRQDLRQVTDSGYKVGFLGSPENYASPGIVSISVRVGKLGLSDEAMEAWDVDTDDYFVLLARFESTYIPLELVTQRDASSTGVKFRVGKCKKYKPSSAQALAAFTEAKPSADRNTPDGPKQVQDSNDGGREREFRKLFVSNSLNGFLKERFAPMLKIRNSKGCSWEEANEILLRMIGLGLAGEGSSGTAVGDPMDIDSVPEAESNQILFCDHLTDSRPPNTLSFPLIAMQFTVRYFIRCTEFCMGCHRKLGKEIEALRPYVCSEPLCLFQYMAMGFGPSIDHEIVTEPYVVDLLVSLCYAAVQGYTQGLARTTGLTASQLPIRTLPVGLQFHVPDLHSPATLRGRVDTSGTLLSFSPAQMQPGDLREGKWVAFRIPGHSQVRHGIITSITATETELTMTVDKKGDSACNWGAGQYGRDTDLAMPFGQPAGPAVPPIANGDWQQADVFPYNTDFDSLTDVHKGDAMRHILDTLPSILEMEAFLKSHPHRTVRNIDRVSAAAFALLRWIVSSNRSCIFQIDRQRPRGDTNPEAIVGSGRDREHERIPGMKGWIQFRFAQGSPDKELRFNRALQAVAARKGIKANPTVFAWHGSALPNWHSIVRTGLDFRDTRCGRAYGNGVYFSHDYRTSFGYAAQGAQEWPNSDLRIEACMSLNEIINAPDEFVSRTPHLVVDQPDWHQCRYLFVQSNVMWSATSPEAKNANSGFHQQATGHALLGPSGAALNIPLSAIPARSVIAEWGKPSIAPRRTIQQMQSDSSDEDSEDTRFLYSDDDLNVSISPQRRRTTFSSSNLSLGPSQNPAASRYRPLTPHTDEGMTDFEPGALDLSTLPRLAEPSFANPLATKSLSRELKKLQELQAITPLHELGWYMDFEEVNNIFQWIIELHSFDPSLPLAKDMKSAGITSIVLEIRFGGEYPMSPPFVRVVRPRFLPFMKGGGGHVTSGGAMCMELLTNTGWSAANSMESVLLQVRMALCSLDPNPARLMPCPKAGQGYSQDPSDYGAGEAMEAYVRAVDQHGWEAPKDLRIMANGM